MCIRRHASAPLDSSTDRTRVRTLPFVVKNQRVIHLYAALKMCIAQRLQGCQSDRISFDFESVHQLLRDCADEAHVDSEAEAKVPILCVVFNERKRLAQARGSPPP